MLKLPLTREMFPYRKSTKALKEWANDLSVPGYTVAELYVTKRNDGGRQEVHLAFAPVGNSNCMDYVDVFLSKDLIDDSPKWSVVGACGETSRLPMLTEVQRQTEDLANKVEAFDPFDL